MRVLRVYHSGRDRAHRARERALAELGLDLTLVVPTSWPDPGSEAVLSHEPFRIIEMPVRRPGDVNRHLHADRRAIARLLLEHRPDILDLHEEPVSLVAREWLRAAGDLPVTMYTAQNVDKRFPPPFAQYETAAYGRITALYPCSRQAASVARGKGFQGLVDVLPLGVDPVYSPGSQSADDDEIVLGLVGRLVPEKGVTDAVRVLAHLRERRSARLLVIGSGPEEHTARSLAQDLGVAEAVDFLGWHPVDRLAELYRQMHVLLVPSRATETWVEQFGRIIIEAQASGAVVVGYRSGAIPEVAGDALLVDEGAVKDLASQVAILLSAPESFAATRAAASARVLRFSWREIAARQLALYERVAGAAPPPKALASPAQRARARAEFGAPAPLRSGDRPFALPVLRRDSTLTRAVGRVLDFGLSTMSDSIPFVRGKPDG